MKTSKAIELKGVEKWYLEAGKKHRVLDQLNLDIHTGEIVILLGKSGSGKTTLLNLLSGIDLPSSGDIIINNTNLTTLTENDRTRLRRYNMGFVFQFFNLIPTLSVEDNLKLPLELTGKKDTQKIDHLLQEVGLLDRKHSFPDKLSGGEQQRVAICRALVHDPEIILADEPTGNLDYETGQTIIDLLDRLVRQEGKTMIMVTHSQDLFGLADRVYHVKQGRLEALNTEPAP